MSLSLDQFVQALSQTGLLPVEEVRAFHASLPEGKRPRDAQQLAQELVRAGKLTRYQAAAVYQGKAKSLVMGEYVVLDRIGAGGMGQVFKAQHRRMKRIVAIKLLPPAVSKDESAIKRFQREVEAAARLEHPNIVTAYDA